MYQPKTVAVVNGNATFAGMIHVLVLKLPRHMQPIEWIKDGRIAETIITTQNSLGIFFAILRHFDSTFLKISNSGPSSTKFEKKNENNR